MMNLNEKQNIIYCLVVSAKGGISFSQLLSDYKEATGESFPLKELGFRTIKDYLENNPEKFELSHNLVKAKPTKNSGHILNMVELQRSKGSRNRRPDQKFYSAPTERLAARHSSRFRSYGNKQASSSAKTSFCISKSSTQPRPSTNRVPALNSSGSKQTLPHRDVKIWNDELGIFINESDIIPKSIINAEQKTFKMSSTWRFPKPEIGTKKIPYQDLHFKTLAFEPNLVNVSPLSKSLPRIMQTTPPVYVDSGFEESLIASPTCLTKGVYGPIKVEDDEIHEMLKQSQIDSVKNTRTKVWVDKQSTEETVSAVSVKRSYESKINAPVIPQMKNWYLADKTKLKEALNRDKKPKTRTQLEEYKEWREFMKQQQHKSDHELHKKCELAKVTIPKSIKCDHEATRSHDQTPIDNKYNPKEICVKPKRPSMLEGSVIREMVSKKKAAVLCNVIKRRCLVWEK